ncbi:hypothetical protein BJ508DRAFT_215554 [Ascobolus immersus RN42]|uniref:3,4-dihydroxy-2-butanone 4-phosphate synthase n=1 Tax=Ascobolus immersus RN42 TaxID=1160509 RepID=A0A3N4HK66_ASCIM|nr:hypothetical protein BJ508DRAFT_215554 [Ascobolus immersus RN42]
MNGKHELRAEGDVDEAQFDSVEDCLEALREGEFIIVLDSTDRENEGDLIIAGQDLTTEKMAFMVKHTSGLICAPTTSDRLSHLSLPQMVPHNTDAHHTAFTHSIDAATHTSTGISAHDRAHTIRLLSSDLSSLKPTDFRRPGHVFPLQAVEGGVLVRGGHTEASVDMVRMAGKGDVAAICELVKDDAEGGMARRDWCLEFGRTWGLRTCTIDALKEFIIARGDKGTSLWEGKGAGPLERKNGREINGANH